MGSSLGTGLPRSSCRPATGADEAFLRRMVYEALFVPPGQAPFPEHVLDEPGVSRYFRRFGERDGDIGRIAETCTGDPVGAAWVRRFTSEEPGYGYVDDATPELTIAVLPAHRGGGIGTTLLTDLLAIVPRCSLSVDRRNPARHLYERFGFSVVASRGDTLTMLRQSDEPETSVLAEMAGPELTWGPGAMLEAGIAAVGADVLTNGRRRIVELGSGLSTVLLARLLTRRRPAGDWRLAAVEHDGEWVERVSAELQREGTGHGVTIVHAPLGPHPLAPDGLAWYDDAALSAGLDGALGGERADLLVVDGPPAYAAGHGLARYPALPVMFPRLARGATVVLDDIDRPGEQEVLRRWERETGLTFERRVAARVAVARVSAV